MKYTLMILLALIVGAASAQNSGEKKTLKEKAEDFGNKVIAQPDAGADTTVDKIMTDNLYITVDPLWRQKGAMIFNDYKLNKTNEEPLVNSFPLPEKKIVVSANINLINQKKPTSDKRAATLAQVKSHLAAYYKDAGQAISAKDLDAKVQSAIVKTEEFTTAQGQKGELLAINDVQSQRSDYIILLLIPRVDGKETTYVQFTYTRYAYEDEMAADPFEWRTFVYPDEEQEYIDFTKKILKTLVIK